MTARADDTAKQAHGTPLVVDRFASDVLRGRVDGTPASPATPADVPGMGAVPRHVTDAERMISIDHGALRIPMLAKPGFGRAALSYGPFEAVPGLAMAVWMLNGHNTSQTLHTYSLLKQAYRFLRGGNAFSIPQQLAGWWRHPARESLLRRVECWIGVRRANDAGIKDNLMVGFFADADRPTLGERGSAFVMHAASHECGDLRVTSSGSTDEFQPDTDAGTSVVYGFQNVEALYVVVVRDGGSISYLAATPGARGAPNVGMMRPVAIERHEPGAGHTPERVFAGVHQAVLGEIGFAVDSRVHGVVVDHVPDLAPQYGGAHAASGEPCTSDHATVGGPWKREGSRRWVQPTAASGLVSAWLTPGPNASGVMFRARDAVNCWIASARAAHAGTLVEVQRLDAGVATTIASATFADLREAFQVLVLDDGSSICVRAAGRVVGPYAIHDGALASATGVGIVGDLVRDCEAHPREVPIPDSFRVHDFWSPRGAREVLRDDFADGTGELDGRVLPGAADGDTARGTWVRSFGSGRFDLLRASLGGGAKVRGEPGNPCPMRTLYTLPWSNPAFAEIEARMTPPGTGRFQRQGGRSGVVLWQDARNHLIVNLWLHDGYDGASISSFLVVNGFDDVYNAVWTNVGGRVKWNQSFRLGVAFDGDRYLVRVDDEPVIVRRVADVYPRAQRFDINRVGLASNWEWGLDTGTVFHEFVGRDAGSA